MKYKIIDYKIKKELEYLLELSSIEWKINVNSKQKKINIYAKNDTSVRIIACYVGDAVETNIECADNINIREVQRISMGLKLALENLSLKQII